MNNSRCMRLQICFLTWLTMALAVLLSCDILRKKLPWPIWLFYLNSLFSEKYSSLRKAGIYEGCVQASELKDLGEFRVFSSSLSQLASFSIVRFHWLHSNVFFYCAISLAPFQLGITCNTKFTQNGSRANGLLFHLSNSPFPSLEL